MADMKLVLNGRAVSPLWADTGNALSPSDGTLKPTEASVINANKSALVRR